MEKDAMISDRLYQYAFEYRKTKLWRILLETDLFAFRSSDGQFCYVSLTGGSEEPITLAVYIGSDGLYSFLRLAQTDLMSLSPFASEELLMQQDCLQCIFVGKDDLSAEEHAEVKGYTRRHGIRVGGKKAYPLFRKYTPNHLPWPLQTEQEETILCEALAAALGLFGLLKGKKPADLGFSRHSYAADAPREVPQTIPLLEYQGNGYVSGQTALPPEGPLVIPAPRATNDIGIASLKKLKKTGIWECKIIRFPQPVQDAPDQIPFFPVALLAVESSSGYILQVPPVENYEDNPEHLMDLFIETLVNEKIRPIKIRVPDERTYAFVRPLCERLKIALSADEDTPALDAAEEDFFIHFDMEIDEQLEELHKIFDTLLDLDGEQLERLRTDMSSLFDLLEEQEALLHAGEKLVSLDAPPHSYVISAALESGCSRHIQIRGDATLLELHSAILDAFDFMDDHAHAFFMDDISWSERDCYYMAGIEDSGRTTEEYTLDQAGLHKGMRFKYIFDLGDEWTFQCRVLKDLKKYTAQPLVIKKTGEAPDQY